MTFEAYTHKGSVYWGANASNPENIMKMWLADDGVPAVILFDNQTAVQRNVVAYDLDDVDTLSGNFTDPATQATYEAGACNEELCAPTFSVLLEGVAGKNVTDVLITDGKAGLVTLDVELVDGTMGSAPVTVKSSHTPTPDSAPAPAPSAPPSGSALLFKSSSVAAALVASFVLVF